MSILDLPQALIDAGVNVRFLDGWDRPAKPGYVWREDNGDPAGHMHHHTASTSYVPNRTKANGYAGLSMDGSARLHQEDYGDGLYEPVYTIANAYPAPISSGAGDRTVLERVRQGIEVVGRQGGDTRGWYGNTHYWNTEYVLNGTGAPLDRRVWDMMLTVCAVQNNLMGWTPYMHIGHGHHTRRKVDLWAGQFDNFDDTIINLREQMETHMHFHIGQTYPEWEPVSWWLYMLEGGVIDANGNSSQIQTVLPWKTDVRLVQSEDFDLIAELVGLSNPNRIALADTGLYRWGKELASLRQKAYT